MSLDDNIHNIATALSEVADELREDEQAYDLAHKALDQFQSLTAGMWDGKSTPSLEHLLKVATQNKDIVLYGKTLAHALEHMYYITGNAQQSWTVRLNKWRPSVRKRIEEADKTFELAIIYLVLRKVKLEIIRQYEEERAEKDKS